MTTTTRHEVEVDTRIAALYVARNAASVNLERALVSVHYAAKDKHVARGTWTMSHAEAVEKVRTLLADCTLPYRVRELTTTLEALEAARTALADANTALAAAEKEYTGWSRFFLVTNVNGHIHSSMHCSTCTPTTDFAWLPTVSGLSEADAVAEHGERLCSVCFPSAPVEWTEGYARKTAAEAQAARDAKAAARDAKAAKKAAYWSERHYAVRITRASDGQVVVFGADGVKGTTLKAARRDAAEYNGYNGPAVVIDLLTMEEVK